MTDDEDGAPRVPIVCPECDTTTRVPISDARETIDRHNQRLHDGADVARVDPDLADRIADLAARDLGLLD